MLHHAASISPRRATGQKPWSDGVSIWVDPEAVSVVVDVEKRRHLVIRGEVSKVPALPPAELSGLGCGGPVAVLLAKVGGRQTGQVGAVLETW